MLRGKNRKEQNTVVYRHMLRKGKEIVGLVCSIQDSLRTCAGFFFFCTLTLRGKSSEFKRLFLLSFLQENKTDF